MITVEARNISLSAIAQSGQCFRWHPDGDGFRIIFQGRVLRARQSGEEALLSFSCDEEEWEHVWRPYLDWDTDYAEIISSIPRDDVFLTAAAAYGQGIRILRQDPWETLITFILSQRKSIPAIQKAVEKLCEAAGDRIPGEEGLFSFPGPGKIYSLGEAGLLSCGLGYRAPYAMKTAEAFLSGKMSVSSLSQLEDDALFSALCSLHGVGSKIANCVMLFGFHRLSAFPVDVWMSRVEKRRYPAGIPIKRYAPYGGVMQQYMFAYERFLEKESGAKSRRRKPLPL